jgi:hypothetical protein
MNEVEAVNREKALVPVEMIEGKILLIRAQKIMLDRDLARLYGVETCALGQAVRRNIERSLEDFMLRLTREEIMRISQFVISSVHPGVKTLKFSKNVMAFTEHGVAMLSSVLNSHMAVQVNIQIMRTFAKLRIMPTAFLIPSAGTNRSTNNRHCLMTGRVSIFFSSSPMPRFNLGDMPRSNSAAKEIDLWSLWGRTKPSG